MRSPADPPARIVVVGAGIGGVTLSDGTALRADRVVLATGGRAARPAIPGSGSSRAHVLRTLDDADRLRTALTPGARLLVVGAGLIGAEVASTASRLGCEVLVVDPVGPPLAEAVGEELAAWLHGEHTAHGIVTERDAVVSFTDTGAGVTAELAAGGAAGPFDAVLLAVGMVPDTRLARAAGLAVDRGVRVGPDHVTSNPAVLAVGDPVQNHGHPNNGHWNNGHWDAAVQHGRRAAATILGLPAPPPGAPWFWSDRHGRHVEVVGSMSDASEIVVRGTIGAGRVAVFGLVGDRLVSAVGVDEPSVLRVARRVIDQAVSVDPAALADPEVGPRTLFARTG